MSVPDLLKELLKELEYQEHLRRTHQDWESRWENVNELISFATEASASQSQPIESIVGQSQTEHTQNDASTEAISTSADIESIPSVIDLTSLPDESDDEGEENENETSLEAAEPTYIRSFIDAAYCSCPLA
jgi:DNA helicase II / ATP-dependent DNA helicase PcrA